jgi:galacturan 1,4-alpha-galacturonidase
MFSLCNRSVLLCNLVLSILITLAFGETCVVPDAAPDGDDAPAILNAFQRCGENGKIVFEKNKTYHVGRIMNTTNLINCEIDLKGTLLVHI